MDGAQVCPLKCSADDSRRCSLTVYGGQNGSTLQHFLVAFWNTKSNSLQIRLFPGHTFILET